MVAVAEAPAQPVSTPAHKPVEAVVALQSVVVAEVLAQPVSTLAHKPVGAVVALQLAAEVADTQKMAEVEAAPAEN